MASEVTFSAREREMIRKYLDKKRITSFSQTTWPFIFFFIPSFFIFLVFLWDGQRGTAIVAYAVLGFAYFLSMHSARRSTFLFADLIEKYEQRLRGHSGSEIRPEAGATSQ